jgi:hypothetical protein
MSKFTLNSFNGSNSPNSNVSFFSKVLFILFTSLFILTGCGGGDSSNSDDDNTYDYTVTFLYENNTEIKNHTVTYGSVIEVPQAPIKPYYVFTQWKEVGGIETIDNNTNTYIVTRDISFKPEYLDTFDGAHIYTQEHLNKVRDNMSGNYILMNDIDLDENGVGFDTTMGWLQIGSHANQFAGTLDGNGHKITGLWIDRDIYNIALFSSMENATIKNLGVEIGSKGVKGQAHISGIAGHISGGTIIANCYVTGNISGTMHNIGGIVGYMTGGTIINSYSTANVNSSVGNVGGIVGDILDGTITNSYSMGNISGTSSISGIVGIIYGSSATITNNAAINPLVTSNNFVNRIVATINGSIVPTVSNNFALDTMIVTGNANGNGNAGTDKTATELRTQSTYSDPVNGDGLGGLGWKFGNDEANPWKMDPTKNDGLPYLYWENR